MSPDFFYRQVIRSGNARIELEKPVRLVELANRCVGIADVVHFKGSELKVDEAAFFGGDA